MDALELLVNRRSASGWLNRHRQANNWTIFCVRGCVRRTTARCSRGNFHY
jgi:hypothetical protein